MLVENHLSTTRCSTCGNVQRAIRKEAYQEKSWVTTDAMVDPLESLARLGAQQMLQAALEQEVEDYLEQARYVRNGAPKGYRSGYLPERRITLSSGWEADKQSAALLVSTAKPVLKERRPDGRNLPRNRVQSNGSTSGVTSGRFRLL
jgi:hypothetical protein